MDLIPLIETLAERISPDIDELSSRDFHPCSRAMWFKHRNVKQRATDARRANFARSIAGEVQRLMRACGYNIVEKEGVLIAKTPDDEFINLVIMTLGKARFNRVAKHGIDPDAEYHALHTMAHSARLSARGNTLDATLFVVVNRDDFDMMQISLDADNDRYQYLTELMADAQNSEEIPTKTEGPMCNWCHYKSFCNGDGEIARVNCRTCANVSVVDGRFECPHGSVTCGNHIYHPQLMECAGYTIKNVDPARMVIDYGDFVNLPEGQAEPGRPSFTSRELFKAAAHELHQDPVLLNAMAVFDGRLETTL